jgi:DNA-binding transcriptional regulator YhcF (GntR family)
LEAGLEKAEQFRLSSDSGVPLYLQIAHEFIYRIESGILGADDKLPGIRKLAKELGVSFLTVDKAYKWLSERRVVETMPGIGVKVVLTLDASLEVRQRRKITRFADKVVAKAIREKLDVMLMAQTIMHRARAHHETSTARTLLFVECMPEYVDDYIAELASSINDDSIEIRGMLTMELERAVAKGGKGLPARLDCMMTTLYHFDFVRRMMEKHDVRVIALSHTLDQPAVQKIISLPADVQLGVLLGPVDPPKSILQTIEFYRDLAAKSIPYSVVSDQKAARRIVANSDVVIYTSGAADFLESLSMKKPMLLIRFVPDQEAINKMRMVLAQVRD